MSKHLSATELADLTGKSRSKVREALVGAGLPSINGPRNTRLFDSAEALRVLFGGSGALNPAAEQARLNAAKADLAEIELAQKRRETVPLADVIAHLATSDSIIKQRVLSVPARAAPTVISCTDVRAAEDAIREELHKALDDLSKHDGLLGQAA